MRNHLLHIAVLLSLLGLASCKDRMPVEENDGKSPIRLAVGGVDIPDTELTRAVITDGTGKTMKAFDVNTKIFMVMKSEYEALPAPYDFLNYGGSQTTKYTVSRGDVTASSNKVVFDATNQKYWDDAHARSSKLSIWAYAQKGMSWTECSFAVDDGPGEYRKESFQTNSKIAWRETAIYPMIFSWKACHYASEKQDSTSVMCQDLLFSNNLVDNTGYSGADGRLAFDPEARKFPQEGEADMKFYHAMSKITIKVVEGEGFDKSSTTDFQFATDENIKMYMFNTEGLFSIQYGGFQQINWAQCIKKMYLKSTSPTTPPYYTLEALVIPNIDDFTMTYPEPQHDKNSRFVKDAYDKEDDYMMEFTIDNNTYRITSGELYDALHPGGSLVEHATEKTNNGTYVPVEAGKNYEFTFTISKTHVSGITAQVVDWENVIADNITPSNARISLKLEERSSDYVSENAEFYRAADPDNTGGSMSYEGYSWETGYTNDYTAKTYDDITHRWTFENWFWPGNTTFYHFRAVADRSTSTPSAPTVVTDGANGDHFVLNHGETYRDYIWGAPFLDDAVNETAGTFKLYYNTTRGFDATGTGSPSAAHQIYKGIGPTADVIKLLMFHMMSDVTINVTTTANTEPNHVELGDGTAENHTTIQFENIHKAGKVLMGNGLVSGTDAVSNYTFTAHPAPNGKGKVIWANYGAIPQDLTDVVLVITTPDKNEYRVSMKDVKATTVPTTNNLANPYSKVGGTGADKDKYLIDQWYPSYKYTYSFKLTKKGIESLTATILDWEDVVADEEEVQIQ